MTYWLNYPPQLVAKRYGIQVIYAPLSKIPPQFVEPSGRGGFDPVSRVVYFRRDSDLVIDSEKRYRGWESRLIPAFDLHEVIHVICQPPNVDVDSVSETELLVPFERAVARTFGGELLEQVVEYQGLVALTTAIKARTGASYLGNLRGSYERSSWWKNALILAETIGLLEEGVVTWRWPQWSRITGRVWEGPFGRSAKCANKIKQKMSVNDYPHRRYS